MPTFVEFAVDTTPPADVAATINGGAATTSSQGVTVAISSSSPDAAQVKIYGDVDPAADANIQPLEANAAWISLASPHAVRLSDGDGAKTIRVKVRDDVDNPSGEATDAITLDTTAPTPNVTSGPTRAKVSLQSGKRATSFTWSSDLAADAWEVRLVPTTASGRGDGPVIDTTNGSANTSGGALAAATPVTTTLDTADVLAAAAGDGDKVAKVFVQGTNGVWSG